MSVLEKIEPHRLFRGEGWIRAMVLPLGVLIFAGVLATWPLPQEPLSASEKRVLRTRVDRFASRYSPEMSDRERSGIVENASWSPIMSTQVLSKHVGVLTFLLLVMAGYLLWCGWSFQGMLKKQGMSLPRSDQAMMLVGTAVVIVVAWSLVSPVISNWKTVLPEEVAIGAVYGGKILLAGNNRDAIRSTDQLTGVFDHELTHLFGQGKYQKIRRDCWLSYAYAAVLALERGGSPTMRKEEVGNGASKKERMSWYTAGVMCAKETASGADPEAEFIKKAGLKEPINPDAPTDVGTGAPGVKSNRVFDYGVAGIAWYLAAGNGDIALSYLDDRSNGIQPLEARERALERVRLLDQKHDGRSLIRTSEIFNEALLYRIKLDREKQEGK
jgi:hypothetical protein